MEDVAEKCKKRKKSGSPGFELRRGLEACSRNRDLRGALSLYRAAAASDGDVDGEFFDGLHLSAYLVNTLLHLCSSSIESLPESERSSIIDFAFKIFKRMVDDGGVTPTEATITSMARIACWRIDGGVDLAFNLVSTMREKYGATPRLRTYSPVLLAFCRKANASRAFEVERHMISAGISPEEPEIAALLEVSAEEAREEKFYEYLHKLRCSVRSVTDSTARVLERWFCSENAARVGIPEWDAEVVRETMARNGGGWHGTGWLGSGAWKHDRVRISEEGLCAACGQGLTCIDINERDTEKFAEAIASLATERETVSNFSNFQLWLEEHKSYEAIIDGANVGLYQQNFADGGFSIPQLESVVNTLYKSGNGKWPLVVLHNKRVKALLENASTRELLEEWRGDKGILYTTPGGSNDDWYWLYAAVKLKCLLVTNDEMRDHIFELLGSNLFSRWKDRHQVRYTFNKGVPVFQMLPPFTLGIQESETGTWHFPLQSEDHCWGKNWLCFSRSPRTYKEA